MLEQQSVPNTFIKSSVYYYVRRVPKHLRQHYDRKRICFSLRTKVAKTAAKRAEQASYKLDEVWFQLSIANKFEHQGLLLGERNDKHHQSSMPLLSEALDYYLAQKAEGKSKNFTQCNKRACEIVYQLIGDKPINQYERQDALAFRDELVSRELAGTTVRRNVGCVRTIINFVIEDYSLQMTNPFHNIFIDKQARTRRRLPVSVDTLLKIQQQCLEIADERRLLILLLSGSLMRLSEAAGLMRDNIGYEGDMMTVSIRPNPLRNLKTQSSERTIPLVGNARVAVEMLLEGNYGNAALFPNVIGKKRFNNNSISAAVNKWLKDRLPEQTTAHSFRHTGRDLLRAVDCNVAIIDAIGGWASSKSAGERYGAGYSLTMMEKYLTAAFKIHI